MTQPMTLEAASETSHGVFGRTEEWSKLWYQKEQPRPKLSYIWGSPGSGKTHLAQTFFDQLLNESFRGIWTSGRLVGQSDNGLMTHLTHSLNLSGTIASSPELLADALLKDANSGFIWVIDDFDQLSKHPKWLWSLWLSMARRGACIILTGTEPPLRMWSGQQHVQNQIHAIQLRDFDDATSKILLGSFNISDSRVLSLAVTLSCGRPKILCAIADGVRLAYAGADTFNEENMNPFSETVDLPSFMIEQICHPGSKRMTWRAGQGDDNVDTLIAAASLVPVVNKDWMAHVVGHQLTTKVWNQFIRLSILHQFRGGYYGIFPSLRSHIAVTSRQTRPWAWEQWTRNASKYYLNLAGNGKISFKNLWPFALKYQRIRIDQPIWPVDQWEQSGWSLRWEDVDSQPYSLTLTTPQNQVLGKILFESYSLDRLVCQVRLADNNSGVFARLLTGAGELFYQYSQIVIRLESVSPTEASALKHLRFAPSTETALEWRLELGNTGYLTWIENLLRAPVGPRPSEPVRIAQQVLQSVRDEEGAEDPEVNSYWSAVSRTIPFRSWFLDALNSADLGTAIGGKTLLALYYIEKQGTHEELAEILHVSRATYFRGHRNALERLADAVFV